MAAGSGEQSFAQPCVTWQIALRRNGYGAEENFNFATKLSPDVFSSISHLETRDPKFVEIGIGYGIELPKYRASLEKRGLL
jgi:hypothetical protein